MRDLRQIRYYNVYLIFTNDYIKVFSAKSKEYITFYIIYSVVYYIYIYIYICVTPKTNKFFICRESEHDMRSKEI